MESIPKRQRIQYSYNTPRSFNPRFSQRNVTLSREERHCTSHHRFPSSQTTYTSRVIGEQNSSTINTIDDEVLEQSVDDDLGQIVVAIDMRDSGTIGCSYYSAQDETLYLIGDIRFAGNESIDTCSNLPSNLEV